MMDDPERIITRSDNNPPELLPAFPPEPSAEAIADAVQPIADAEVTLPYDAAKHASLRLQALAFAEACGKWRDLKTIANLEQSEKLTDFIKGASGLKKRVEETRKAEKKVWDEKGKIVQEAFTPITDILDRAEASVKPLQADWLRREQARIDAEKAEALRIANEKAAEAARLAAQAAARNDVVGEAEAEKAAKEAAKMVKTAARPERASAGSASGGGRSMSLRKVRIAEIHSQNALYMHFREHPAMVDLIQRLANEAVRSGVEFPENVLTVKTAEVAV